MSNELPSQPPEPETHAGEAARQEPRLPGSQPTGFAEIARRIRSRTTDLLAIAIVLTDLLAIAIVLTGGLAIGGRLIAWWSTDLDEIASPVEVAEAVAGTKLDWDAEGAPVALNFGESPVTLERQVVTGSRDEAIRRLLAACRRLAETLPFPKAPPDTAELALLEKIELFEPVDEGSEAWRLYHMEGAVSTVTAVRQPPRDISDSAADGSTVPRRRVVCWGLAFPSGPNRWTLFTFHSMGETGSTATVPEISLPPGAEKIASLRDASGASWIVFAGTGAPRDWMDHFDNWFHTHGGARKRSWDSTGTGWNARFAFDSKPIRADVQFNRSGRADLTGIIRLNRVGPSGEKK